jgi:tRNA nucleotidyltransferase (CCA-adding enzyme)
MEIHAPGAVRWICRTLEEAGFETWTVGGAVRDALTGRPSGDWDLTTRAHPNQVRRLFRRTVPVGIDHGTVGVLARDGTMYEVTTFRRDVETTGRHAVVAFAETLDEDLARRDFTINAVAWHPLREVFHDPWGGAEDLRERLLRTVGDPAGRFAEDYLRVLRALRFAGRFRLRVQGATWRAVCTAVPELRILSPERVREELDKVLADTGRPSGALALYAASGALGFLHPELDTAEARSVWPFALRAVDHLPADEAELRLAALLSAAGSTEAAVSILARLRSSNRRIDRVGAMAGAVARATGSPDSLARLTMDAGTRRRWMVALGRALVAPTLTILAARARVEAPERAEPDPAEALPDAASAAIRAVRVDLDSGLPLATGDLAITGRDLIRSGYRPGPAFGRVFDRLLLEVLDDRLPNETGALLRRATALLAPDEDAEGGRLERSTALPLRRGRCGRGRSSRGRPRPGPGPRGPR